MVEKLSCVCLVCFLLFNLCYVVLGPQMRINIGPKSQLIN